MTRITTIQLQKLTEEKSIVEAALQEASLEKAAATELGDLSENSERDAALQNYERYSRRLKEINEILNSHEIIPVDNSPRITIGSTIEVTEVDVNGNVIKPTRTFRLDNEGDTILQGVIGVSSPLGSAIINGTNGTYKIANNGGKYFKVRKIKEVV